MNLVNYIYLEAATGGRVDRVLKELTHLVNPGIGGRINLKQIDKSTTVDFLASRTDTTRCSGDPGFAI
ncbi:MAG: hypothetical protein FD131_4496 [Rhodocyclaceae bacterium]|nr:MAG: hypothetical protein FD131_4496 [Rhodocyclaceae bacterium]